MIKRVCIYSLPEGTDGEKFWQWHTRVHSKDILKYSGNACKKYVINRVTKKVRGKELCYGFVETWWTSEEEAERVFESWKNIKLPEGISLTDDWWNRIVNGFSFAVEEYTVLDETK